MDWEQKEPGRNPRPKESERRRKAPQSGQGTRRDPSRREQEETRRRREEQQRRRREQQRKRRKQARRAQRSAQRRQEAQRTPARPLPRRKLVRKLVTTLAVVAALILGLTIFFKVRTVRVTGNVKYTAQEVIDAAGIELGENLLTFGEARVAAKIRAELSYVAQVQIGIKLPDTVNIDIVETEAVYAIRSAQGTWWLMNCGGKLLEPLEGEAPAETPRVLGIQAENPVQNQQVTPAADPEPEEGEPSVESVGSPSERLNAAIQILTALEQSDRTGKITTVDVSSLYDMRIWYGESYQVLLKGPSDLSYKIRYMVEAMEKLEQEHYSGGVLDLSFQNEGEAVFTPW